MPSSVDYNQGLPQTNTNGIFSSNSQSNTEYNDIQSLASQQSAKQKRAFMKISENISDNSSVRKGSAKSKTTGVQKKQIKFKFKNFSSII